MMTTPPPLPDCEEPAAAPCAPPVCDPSPVLPPPLPRREPPLGECAGPMPPTYLVWNLVLCLGCFITGIIGMVFGSQVSQRWRIGDVEGARRASDNARLMLLASVVLGLINVPFLMLYLALT